MSISVSATLDHLAEGRRPWFLLFLLCLALYVPGIVTLPVVDRDEARVVQASRQMLETGDFVRIRYQDEARNKKPVGIYWLQAASVAAFSDAAAPMVWPAPRCGWGGSNRFYAPACGKIPRAHLTAQHSPDNWL